MMMIMMIMMMMLMMTMIDTSNEKAVKKHKNDVTREDDPDVLHAKECTLKKCTRCFVARNKAKWQLSTPLVQESFGINVEELDPSNLAYGHCVSKVSV